ncbi:MAG TPA: Bro-N domain-containing protein [Coxiellaceae bacterium]|nr:MAG: phage antirepressor protein [Gammaproteobacteria bacterium RIFCSPHIGHO2_12_FULL_36_30]HLB56315.1 Bro-N domain-containing protein [Coxiellaceae bacterium]
MNTEKSIVLFQEKKVRRIWYNDTWFFVIVDVIAALTDSPQPDGYLKDLRRRDPALSDQWQNIVVLLFAETEGGAQKINCANTENILRIIQSIPSAKAEPFKRWLAKVGYERIQEIENPELAQERMKKLYEQKGYSKEWIDKRLRGIAIRQNLTDEWKERGVMGEDNYAILTAQISKATFGMTPTEYRQFKNLPKRTNENLRDHMTDLELIFTMLGEKVTTEISKKEKPNRMPLHKKVAKRGGDVAGNARKNTEKELGESIITKKNFLKNNKKEILVGNIK